MALLVPNNGEDKLLGTGLGKYAAENQTLKLFATNVTPAETDTAGSYTVATGGGYADKTLTSASWTMTPGAPTSAGYAQQTWTFTGTLTTNGTVYGYYVVRASTADILWAEAFTPFTPTNNGDQILLTPTITAD